MVTSDTPRMPVTSKGYARTGPPLWKRADHPDSTPAAAPFCEKWSVRVPEFFSARVPPIRVRQTGRGDPRSMWLRLVHDTQVLGPVVGCGLRVEIDSVHCCLLLICRLLLRVELLRCDAATHVRRGTIPQAKPIHSDTRRLCRAHSLGRMDLNAAEGCRALVQQRVYVRSARCAVHLAGHAPRAGHESKFGVDGLDVAHPPSLGPYAVVHTSPT
jgi:hypothetical protein